ncbi:hypothetical protein Hanom_Chr05g00404761 [Helianthus anomalus]
MEPPHFCYWKQVILSPTGHLYKLHFLVFSIADLGPRGRTRCDSSPSWRKRPNHPAVIPCFNNQFVRFNDNIGILIACSFSEFVRSSPPKNA